MTLWTTPHCDVENTQILCQEKLVSSRMASRSNLQRGQQWVNEIANQNIAATQWFWYRVWPPVAAITTLIRRRMLRTRTSILSGIIAPQAFNRASRNLTTITMSVIHISEKSPIWSKKCFMGFRLGLRESHCMTSTSSPHTVRISCSIGCGIVMYKHKVSLEICPSPGKDILAQDTNVTLLVTVPSITNLA